MKITRAVDIDHAKIVMDGCMVTVSGTVIDLFNPAPHLLTIGDIAHGLACNNRWNGHTWEPYSIAEHSIRVAGRAPVGKKLTALMHDAEEAYWGDVIAPLKNILKQKCPEIVEKMRELRYMIFDKFQVPLIDLKQYDQAELEYEFHHLILKPEHRPLSWRAAKQQWIECYNIVKIIV